MNIIMVYGLPGSGKSTLARVIANENEGSIILSLDDLLIKNGIPLFNKETVFHAGRMTLFMATQAVTKNIKSVVIDEHTCYVENRQDSFSKIAEISGGTFKIVKTNTPWNGDIEECHRKTSLPFSMEEMRKIKESL